MAQITDVRIYKLKIVGPQKAFASVTLDDEFAVHGIKVMQKDDGTLWVSFPARKDESGEYRDIFHPVTKEAREKIINAVIDAYRKETAQNGEDSKRPLSSYFPKYILKPFLFLIDLLN